jgi:GDP-L-fucose synthase
LVAALKKEGYKKIFTVGSSDGDLRDPSMIEKIFRQIKPEIVFSLAAKVGGILENKTKPADFYYDNILIGAYTYNACKNHNVSKLINVGAGCGYPIKALEPLKEDVLWDGFPQKESASYSLAKRMLVVQSMAYNDQYGLNSITAIPSNIYGEFDNFNLEQSHVIPALVRKFLEAKRNNLEKVVIWGDGSVKRDFIHAYDVSKGLIEAARTYESTVPFNLAYGQQYTIREIVANLKEISGFSGRIEWDKSMPSGQLSREFSTEHTQKTLPKFKPTIALRDGLCKTYEWLNCEYENIETRL